jgi:DNA/RNA-binding domain of Phe-tRNA-synthetase-like protein
VARGATNVAAHPELEARKRYLEEEMRSRFQNPDDIKASRVVRAYVAYYRRFEKTYHLVQQFKSISAKGRPLPTVSALVDVMFMAEMKNLLLTAGHDLASVVPPITLDAGTGDERYIKLSQEEQVAKRDDMMVTDGRGILSTVIHGPDYRTRITPESTDALYVVYAPEGVEKADVCAHLRDIQDSVLLFSPAASFDAVGLLSSHGLEPISPQRHPGMRFRGIGVVAMGNHPERWLQRCAE